MGEGGPQSGAGGGHEDTSPVDASARAVGDAFPSALGSHAARVDPLHIGPYRILKRLARGGMGVVYLAQREGGTPSRQVALKVVRRGGAVEDVLVRFARERAVLASLDHPSIARLLDAGESDTGESYFVMEFVDGLPLDEWCDTRRLTVAQRIALFRTVCEAVHHAHRNLVVHRDLKPRNILVTNEGVPKLLDFGIAKLLNPTLAQGVDAPTAAGLQLMTPEYAAPEQVRGETISTAADVYSLGVVLYELLSGRRPYRFVTREPAEIDRVVSSVMPRPPSDAVVSPIDDPQLLAGSLRGDSSIGPEALAERRGTTTTRLSRQLAGDLDQITLMALRKEPQRRYASAEALGQDLRRHLDREPVAARPDSLVYRTSRFASRHRELVVSTVLLLVVLSAGVAATAWQAHRAGLERDAAVEANESAVRRLGEVRTLVRSLLFDYYDALARIAGATEVRRKLVENAVGHLDRLRRESSDDAELLIELAGGHRRLAEIQGGRRAGNLGDTAAALETLALSAELLDEAGRHGGDRATIESHRAANHLLRSDNERLRGDLVAALASAQQALSLRETLAAGGSDLEQRNLALALASVGDLLEANGRIDEARTMFERSLSMRQALLAAKPNDADARRELTTALLRIGWMEMQTGRPERAVEHYREMLSIRESILAASETGRARRDVMRAHAVLAQALEATGQMQGAIESARTELALAEQLARDDPQNERARSDLIVARYEAGSILARAGDGDTAIPLLRLAIDGARTSLEREPSNRVLSGALFAAREALADLLRRDPRSASEAAQLYRLALAGLPPAPVAGEDGSGDGSVLDLDRARIRISLATVLVDLGSKGEPSDLLALAKSDLDGLPPTMLVSSKVRLERARWALAQAERLVEAGELDAALDAVRSGRAVVQAHASHASKAALPAMEDLSQRLDSIEAAIAERRR